MKYRRLSAPSVVACVLASFACSEPLSPIELIDKTRVVAAQVNVQGDTGRVAPLPGEVVEVRWLVLDPEPSARFAYSFEACVAENTNSALAACADAPLAVSESLEADEVQPMVAFELPSTASGNERLAVMGYVCTADTSLNAEKTTCSDGAQPQAVRIDFSADDGSHPNQNPAITRVTLDGRELDPESATVTDCDKLPKVKAGKSKQPLSVELDPESRDTLIGEDSAPSTEESLLVSYFVTAGSMHHAWSSISASAPWESVSSDWSPPEAAAETRLVRIVVVARDGRGGSDSSERRVCLTP